MVLSGNKLCPDCQEHKDFTEFGSNKARSDGVASYCRLCYSKRQRDIRTSRKNNPEAPPESKKCPQCNTVRHREDFTKSSNNVGGLSGWCRECSSINLILRKYKLSKEEYDRLLTAQEYKCAIRGCDRRPEAVDHDHSCCPGVVSCGKCVRGILCSNCNRGLGYFSDSVPRLHGAIEYLNLSTDCCSDFR
jgi:hypothetical protein